MHTDDTEGSVHPVSHGKADRPLTDVRCIQRSSVLSPFGAVDADQSIVVAFLVPDDAVWDAELVEETRLESSAPGRVVDALLVGDACVEGGHFFCCEAFKRLAATWNTQRFDKVEQSW